MRRRHDSRSAMNSDLGEGVCATGASIVSTSPITQVTPGQCIAISAYGIDTDASAGSPVQSGLESPIGVDANYSVSVGSIGLAAVFRVPPTLAPGVPVTVRIK